MTDASDDRILRIRATSHRTMGAIACAAAAGGVAAWTAAADALVDALLMVDTGNTPEHDERTRDLEELTNERDAAVAEKDRQLLRANRFIDERDAEKRLAKMANDELEKTRALVDELRAELSAPSIQSDAVKKWLSLSETTRKEFACHLRMSPASLRETLAADALDSLVTHAPEPPARVTWHVRKEDGSIEQIGQSSIWSSDAIKDACAETTTDAASEVGRLKAELAKTQRWLMSEQRSALEYLKEVIELRAQVRQ